MSLVLTIQIGLVTMLQIPPAAEVAARQADSLLYPEEMAFFLVYS